MVEKSKLENKNNKKVNKIQNTKENAKSIEKIDEIEKNVSENSSDSIIFLGDTFDQKIPPSPINSIQNKEYFSGENLPQNFYGNLNKNYQNNSNLNSFCNPIIILDSPNDIKITKKTPKKPKKSQKMDKNYQKTTKKSKISQNLQILQKNSKKSKISKISKNTKNDEYLPKNIILKKPKISRRLEKLNRALGNNLSKSESESSTENSDIEIDKSFNKKLNSSFKNVVQNGIDKSSDEETTEYENESEIEGNESVDSNESDEMGSSEYLTTEEEEEEDRCFKCNEESEFLKSCVSCPKMFHLKCVDGVFKSKLKKNEKNWSCWYCVKKIELKQKLIPLMPSKIASKNFDNAFVDLVDDFIILSFENPSENELSKAKKERADILAKS